MFTLKHKYNNKITNITIRTRMLNLKMVLGDGWGPSWCVYILPSCRTSSEPFTSLIWCGVEISWLSWSQRYDLELDFNEDNVWVN